VLSTRQSGEIVAVEAIASSAIRKFLVEDTVAINLRSRMERWALFDEDAYGGADPLVTARDGLQNLRVTDAILEAARTGATVKISAKEA
jgi:predicted dehydrogenase